MPTSAKLVPTRRSKKKNLVARQALPSPTSRAKQVNRRATAKIDHGANASLVNRVVSVSRAHLASRALTLILSLAPKPLLPSPA